MPILLREIAIFHRIFYALLNESHRLLATRERGAME